MRGELADFVEIVRIASKGNLHTSFNAHPDELRLWAVVVEVHLRSNIVLLQHPDDRHKQPRWHFVVSEDTEGVGENPDAGLDEALQNPQIFIGCPLQVNFFFPQLGQLVNGAVEELCSLLVFILKNHVALKIRIDFKTDDQIVALRLLHVRPEIGHPVLEAFRSFDSFLAQFAAPVGLAVEVELTRMLGEGDAAKTELLSELR